MMAIQRLLRAAGLALVAALACAGPVPAQDYTPRAETPEEFPDHPNREDAFYACSACHAFQLVAQQGMNRRQWDESVQLMIDRHNMAPPAAEERTAILDYLTAAFPQRAPTSAPGGWKNPFAPR
jgi:hypothetical protein